MISATLLALTLTSTAITDDQVRQLFNDNADLIEKSYTLASERDACLEEQRFAASAGPSGASAGGGELAPSTVVNNDGAGFWEVVGAVGVGLALVALGVGIGAAAF